MRYTRRDFGKMALATVPAAGLLPVTRLMAAAKPNSVFGGVWVGTITYSFRGLSTTAEDTLKYCVECGISGIELMSNVAERYAGSPAQQGRGGMPGGSQAPEPAGWLRAWARRHGEQPERRLRPRAGRHREASAPPAHSRRERAVRDAAARQ